MKSYFTGKRLLLYLAAAVILVLAGRGAKQAYDRYLLRQRLLEEEIYMFHDSYMYTSSVSGTIRTVYAYYMVCEPEEDKAALVEQLERLMEEKQAVQGARDYYREKFGELCGYDDLRISVEFYKPSKKAPIGWQPRVPYDINKDRDIGENLLLSINVPWDAESIDEHTYNFWGPDTPFDNMKIVDAYTRQTAADGSVILIPEVREKAGCG